MPFGKFTPQRIWTSNILLSYIYYLQDDIDQQYKSLENLFEVFIMNRVNLSFNGKQDFALNCILFYTLLASEPLYELYAQKDSQNMDKLMNVLEVLN